jgi:hypothetical protein
VLTNPAAYEDLTGAHVLADLDGDGIADMLVGSGEVVGSADAGEHAWTPVLHEYTRPLYAKRPGDPLER